MMKTILIYTACWIGMAALGIFNGILREYSYGLYMKDLAAHQLSTLFGLVFVGAYIWFLTGVRQISSAKQAFIIGIIWLGMTVVFEFIFGHYVIGHTWPRLLQDYNLIKGRVWSSILIWITIAPYIFYRIRSCQYAYNHN